MQKLLQAALLAALLCACSLSGADLLPLQSGNTWTYREALTGDEFTVRVGAPIVTNDRVYHSLSGYTPQRLLVRVNEYGNLVYIDEETGLELIVNSFEPFEGGWWDAGGRPCSQLGQTLEKRGTFDGAAGPFRDVLQIRYRTYSCADAGTEFEQYAENIGMVRRVTQTIAGPRTYNLVYARVGSAVIDTLPHARFTMTAYPKAGADSMIVTLRLKTNSSADLVLPFPSAQEYEVQILDAKGEVLWKWSDGRFFDQAAHERQIGGEWLVRLEIPNPPRSSAGPSAEILTVQAWVTTSGTPRFAATVPVIFSSNGN